MLPSTYGITSIFLVGVFGFPSDVTIMQVGMKFTSAFSTVNTILSAVFYPMVNREKRNMQPTRFILLGVGFFLSLVMFFGSHFLITNWLQFENSLDMFNTVQLVKVLSPIPFLMGVISGYGVNGLLVFLKDKAYSWITIMASLIMILSAIYLVPRYNFLGGAIAFLLGRSMYALVLYIVFNKTTVDFSKK
jgi:O-antigen/teichoic acid export membrane protein